MITSPGHSIEKLDDQQRERHRTYLIALEKGLSLLPDKPEETSITTLAALWHFAAGNSLSAHRAAFTSLPALTVLQFDILAQLIARRSTGAPLAHITGRQSFMNLELLSSTDALIPREETALLGQAALAKLQTQRDVAQPLIIDVCTGSGNLALALCASEPRARAWGADLSENAVALATRNAIHTGLEKRVRFRTGDLLAPFDESMFHAKIDLLICNPPYISSGKVTEMANEISEHEPRLAFDGGPLGIAILQRLIRDAPRFLRTGGWLAFEIGVGQGRGVRRKLEQQPYFSKIEEVHDAHGQIRALMACRNEAAINAKPERLGFEGA
jgi:release factor glutamine methyltransferase